MAKHWYRIGELKFKNLKDLADYFNLSYHYFLEIWNKKTDTQVINGQTVETVRGSVDSDGSLVPMVYTRQIGDHIMTYSLLNDTLLHTKAI